MNKSFLTKLKNWKNSLLGQLLLRFWICLLAFFALIGSIQYHSLKNTLYSNAKQNLVADYNSIRNKMMDWLVSEAPPRRFPDLKPGNFVAFYSSNMELKFLVYSYGQFKKQLPDFSPQQKVSILKKFASGQPFVAQSLTGERFMLLVRPVLRVNSPFATEGRFFVFNKFRRFLGLNQPEPKPDIPELGFVVIGEPLAEEDRILKENIRGYIYNAFIVLLFSTLITAVALRKPLRPLLSISGTARKIAEGQYNLRLPYEKTATEIEQLREALNHMLEELELALKTERYAKDQMARFIADASHELRTPLTSLRGFLEILQRSDQTNKEALDSAHKTMLIETERLIRLTEGLLTLNRIAQEDMSKEKNRNLSVPLQEVLSELLPLFGSLLKNRILKINGEDYRNISELSLAQISYPLKGDELKQILYNLISNAVQHTEKNGIIEISAGETDSGLTLAVKDNGKGIPPEDIPHIFERFFRGDRSRSRRKGQGAGLGLAIVSEIVKLRGGTISVESEPDRGTQFTITFPNNQKQSKL